MLIYSYCYDCNCDKWKAKSQGDPLPYRRSSAVKNKKIGPRASLPGAEIISNEEEKIGEVVMKKNKSVKLQDKAKKKNKGSRASKPGAEIVSTRKIGSVRSVKVEEDDDSRWQRKKAGGKLYV